MRARGTAASANSLTIAHRFTVDLVYAAAAHFHFGATPYRQAPLSLIKFCPGAGFEGAPTDHPFTLQSLLRSCLDDAIKLRPIFVTTAALGL